jgi:hypothetical protein
MNKLTIESLEDAVEYFFPDAVTKERREKAIVRRHEEIAEAEAKREKESQPPVREREDWTHDSELREIKQPVKKPIKKNVAHPLRKHTKENGVAGHGDYGIVREPCPVHLTKHEQVTAGLWQQGIEWR